MGDRETAVKFYNQAVKNAGDTSNPTHLTTAYQLFSSACIADPLWWEAAYQAGNNNSDLKLYDAAVANWRRALECNPEPADRAKILVNIGWRLHSLGRTHEALEATESALELDKNLALAWLNLSLIYQTLDRADEMLSAARIAWSLQPDSNTEIALAFALLFNGKFAEGLKHFESRFEWRLKNFLQYPYPKWTGQPDKTVFLVADQGLGDTLSYARFVELAAKKCKYMHLYIQPELLRLFTHAFAWIPNVNLIPSPAPFPEADYWSTFVSLPFALGLTDEEIVSRPQIEVQKMTMGVNWRVPDRKLHVGIAWAGSPLNDIDVHRNIPVRQFFELCKVPGVQLYSLQVGERNKDMDDVGGAALVRNLQPYIRDVVDTIALLNDLDLVICCESALGHIAATAGKECWIPYSANGRDYRAGLRGENPIWTPNHRFFRQEIGETWTPVFERIAVALKKKIHSMARPL